MSVVQKENRLSLSKQGGRTTKESLRGGDLLSDETRTALDLHRGVNTSQTREEKDGGKEIFLAGLAEEWSAQI